MQAGDTLKSLARRVYGNEAYWYVLADANGLDEGSARVAGSTLTVPEVRTSLNDANTFKPYNPADVTRLTAFGNNASSWGGVQVQAADTLKWLAY